MAGVAEEVIEVDQVLVKRLVDKRVDAKALPNYFFTINRTEIFNCARP